MKINITEPEMQELIIGLESRICIIDERIRKDGENALLQGRRAKTQALLGELSTLSRRVVE